MPINVFDQPERFIAGTVGPPGQRTFFLQVRQGTRLVSMSLEKEQVAALADRCNDLVDMYAPAEGSERAAADLMDVAALDSPIEDEFRIVSMGLAWEPEEGVVIIDCSDGDLDEITADRELLGDDHALVEDDQRVRVVLSPAACRAFARRSLALVAAGRKPCPFCGLPLDPSGHVCPRANGYRR